MNPIPTHLPPKSPPANPPLAPALIIELAEATAVYAIRLTAIATRWQDAQAISQPLNILPRTASPNLTKAALNQLPHIDLDFASVRLGDVALLDFMYDWASNPAADRKTRPLQFRANEPSVLDLAAGERLSYTIDEVSGKGFVQVLDWWFRHSPDLFFIWTENAIDEASANGQLDVLQWWFCESGIPMEELKYSAAAMDQASGNGLDHVLEWWLKSSGLRKDQLKYSERAMGLAAANGHWTTLAWWMSSGLDIKGREVMDYAASKDRMDVLEWCLLQPKILRHIWFGRSRDVPDLVTGAVQRGNRQLLLWFAGVEELHVHWDVQCWAAASKAAAKKGDLLTLRWFFKHGWLLGSKQQLIHLAAASGDVRVMDWLDRNIGYGVRMPAWIGLEMDGFISATEGGFIPALDFLVDHGYTPDTHGCYYSYASGAGQFEALEWWSKYDGEFGQDEVVDAIVTASDRSNNVKVLDWWLASGLLTPEALGEVGLYDFLAPLGKRGELDTIRWWVEKAGTEYDMLIGDAVAGASAMGHMDVLEYYLENCEPLEAYQVQHAIAAASREGRVDVLEWWLKSGDASDSDFVEAFSLLFADYSQHSPQSMLWWTQVFGLTWKALRKAGAEPMLRYESVLSTYTAFGQGLVPATIGRNQLKTLVQWLCGTGSVCHLQNLHRSRFNLAHDAHGALIRASQCKQLNVLKWWKLSGLPIEPPTPAEYDGLESHIQSWWSRTGLVTWT